MGQNFSSGLHDAGATSSMDSADAEGPSPPAAAAPLVALVAEAGCVRSPARVRSQNTMPHPDADVCVRRAPCVCTESLLLLTFSIGAAETLLESTGGCCPSSSSMCCSAARRRRPTGVAIRLAQSTPRAAPVVGGGLGRLGALRDARVCQYERLSVCAGRVWCHDRMWAR